MKFQNRCRLLVDPCGILMCLTCCSVCVCVCGQQLTNECRSYILCLCAPNTRTYHQANPRGLLCMPAGDNGRQSKHDSQSETRFFDLLVWLSLNWHAQATLQQISVATWSLRQQSAPAPGFPNAKPRKKISKGSVVVHAVVPHPDSLLSPSNGFGLCPQHDTKHREKTHRTSMDFCKCYEFGVQSRYFMNLILQQTYNPPDPTQMTDYSTQLCACPVTTTPSPSDDTELTPWQSCSSRCRSSRKRVISHASMGTLTVTWNVLLIRSASAMHVGMFPWITSFLASSTHSASRPADFRRRFRPPIPTSRLKSPTDSK